MSLERLGILFALAIPILGLTWRLRCGNRSVSAALIALALFALAVVLAGPVSLRRASKMGATGAEKFSYRPPASNDAIGNRTSSESEPGAHYVLVLDKSHFMAGKGLALAKLAALDVVENLSLNDEVGILAFDDAFQWIVPIRKIADRDSINEAIGKIDASGNGRMAPALEEALRGIVAVGLGAKHIVLLYTGRDKVTGAISLAARAAVQHVTISALQVGPGDERESLARIAQSTGGEFLRLRSPWEIGSAIPQALAAHTARAEADRATPSQ